METKKEWVGASSFWQPMGMSASSTDVVSNGIEVDDNLNRTIDHSIVMRNLHRRGGYERMSIHSPDLFSQ